MRHTNLETTLGSPVNFLALMGGEVVGQQVQQQGLVDGLGTDSIVAAMPQTAQSIIFTNQLAEALFFQVSTVPAKV